jgi:hypothetical protein
MPKDLQVPGDRGPQNWRARSDSTAVHLPSSKRRTALTLLAIVVVLIGGVLFLVRLMAKFEAPTFLSITVTEYHPPYPPNKFALRDSDRMRALFPGGKIEFESQEGARMRNTLKSLKEVSGPLVLYLNMHALCHNGEIFLLPADATPDNSNGWLHLERDVLEPLRLCTGTKDKLLILDIVHPLADARLGVLSDSLSSSLAKRLAELENDLPCFVLCPCKAGQSALASEELHQSIFGYYLAEGLSGHADGYNAENSKDLRVTVQEIFRFVQERVERWAIMNRDTQQSPQLFGKHLDFPLITASQATNPTQPASPAPEQPDAEGGQNAAAPQAKEPYPEGLTKVWDIRNTAWRNRVISSVAPELLRQLEAGLLRAELAWRGSGESSTRDLDSFARDIEEAKKPFRDAAQNAAERINKQPSLARIYAEMKRERARRSSKLFDLLSTIFDKLKEDSNSAEKPDDHRKATFRNYAKIFEELRDDPTPGKVTQAFDIAAPVKQKLEQACQAADQIALAQSPEKGNEPGKAEKLTELKTALGDGIRRAWMVFQIAAEDPKPTVRKLEFLLALLASSPADFSETRFLNRLVKRMKDENGSETVRSMHLALQLIRSSELARNVDARYYAWVREPLKEALTKRDEAISVLLGPDVDFEATVNPKLEGALRRIDEVQDTIARAEHAEIVYEEGLHLLACNMQFFAAQAAPPEGTWTNAVRSLERLGRLLTTPRLPLPTELPVRTLEAQRYLRSLEEPLRETAENDLLERVKAAKPASYVEIETLLDSPMLRTRHRIALWNTLHGLGEYLNERTHKLDEADNAQRRGRSIVGESGSGQMVSAAQRARFRARMVIDLLTLGGLPEQEVRKLDKAYGASTTDDQALDALGDQIRQAWGTIAVARFENLVKERNWLAADRLARVLNPFDRQVGGRTREIGRNPSLELRLREIEKLAGGLDQP